jgi:hypothetical protein
MLLRFAKAYVQQKSIPWRCIEKATDNQLKTALRKLFPKLTVDWK